MLYVPTCANTTGSKLSIHQDEALGSLVATALPCVPYSRFGTANGLAEGALFVSSDTFTPKKELPLNPSLEKQAPFFTVEVKRWVDTLAPKHLTPIMLSIGMPDAEPLPLFKKALVQLITASDKLFGYPPVSLCPELEEGLKTWFQHRYNTPFNPKQCLLYSGSNDGLFSILSCVLSKPARQASSPSYIWTPDPAYTTFTTAQELGNHTVLRAPLTPENDYQFNFKAAWESFSEEKKKNIKGLILNYPNNPTGALASPTYLKETLAFAKQHGLLVINDFAYADCYSTEATAQKPFSLFSLLEPDDKDTQLVELHSFSKSMRIPGARLGFALFSPALCQNSSTKPEQESLLELAHKARGAQHCGGPPLLFQKAVATVLSNPKAYQADLDDMQKEYSQRSAFLRATFQQLGWPVVSSPKNSMPFFLWVKIPPEFSSSKAFVKDVIQKTGVAFIPGEVFGQNGQGFMRVSTTQPLPVLKEAAERLLAAYSPAKQGS